MDSSLEKMYPVCLIPLVSKMSCNKSDTPQGLATLPSGQKSVGKPFLTSLDFRTTGGLPAKKGDDRTQFELHHTCVNFIIGLNQCNNDVYRVTSRQFLQEFFQLDDKYFMSCLHAFLQQLSSLHMFVRVERPYGSKRFVMGYMKCDRVFSFDGIFKMIHKRLNRVPPKLLTKVETEENKALRLKYVGQTNYEKALNRYWVYKVCRLSVVISAKDEESANALLDGGDDPNEVNWQGINALHAAAWRGCRLPLFQRILGMIKNPNKGDKDGHTALMSAVMRNHLDIVVSLMNHPEIDLNVQDQFKETALHNAVRHNNLAILQHLLSDDRIDTSLKDSSGRTPLQKAIVQERDECERILREHGAREE